MRIRNMTAETLPAAMSRVREELGPDAVILSTHTDPQSGSVRVTAALDEGDSVHSEVDRFEQSVAGIELLRRALDYHGIPASLADPLLGLASNLDLRDPAMALAGALDESLRFSKLAGCSFEKPLMLAGAPGAGKSSSAAKLCTLARINGLQSRIITMDSAKAGALAQVTTYGEALGAKVIAADSPALLTRALAARRSDELAVIDTVGVNPFEKSELAALAEAAEAAGADLVLVMQGGGDPLDADEAARAFAKIGAKALIVTKLDLTRRLGSLLIAAQASGVPLMAFAQSPQIVAGLKPLNPVSLARLLLFPVMPAEEAGPETGDLP
jgi:flagellar biosynthesis protein FlhF